MNESLCSETDPSNLAIESRRLRDIPFQERGRLRQLTDGTPDSHMLSVLRENPPHVQCFLAREANEIIGWSLARWFKPLSERPRNAHISVFVAPAWRRRGLGRALTDAAASFALAQGLVPWVSATRPDQLDFYQSCGDGVRISRSPFQSR